MDACVVCKKPLTLLIDEEEDGNDLQVGATNSSSASYVDDDVNLRCGCHFHWQCLLETTYELASCPHCRANILSIDSSGNQQLLCNLRNEGGFQESLDILPLLTEESYLRAYPEERKPRAFLEFCAEGDIPAIIDLLNDDNEIDEGEESMPASPTVASHEAILGYQDQLSNMRSALHVTIQNQKTDVAWLLLLLASNVDYSVFPEEVKSVATEYGITRNNRVETRDIRVLKDGDGMTAFDRARSMGGIWESWVKEGIYQQEPLLQAP